MSDHPVFGSYEDRNEWYHKVLRETWNQFCDSPPADIQAIVWYLVRTKEDRAITDDEYERLAQSDTYPTKLAQRKAIRFVEGRYRLSVLLDLLDYVSFHGPNNVPRYEDLASEERENMRSWRQLGAAEAAQYGKTTEVQRRRIKLEQVLDAHHPDWVGGNLSREEKKGAAAKISQNGAAPISLATIRKDIAELRKMRR